MFGCVCVSAGVHRLSPYSLDLFADEKALEMLKKGRKTECTKVIVKRSRIGNEHLGCELENSKYDMQNHSSIQGAKDRSLAETAEQKAKILRMHSLMVEMKNSKDNKYNQNSRERLWPIVEVFLMICLYHSGGTSRSLFNQSSLLVLRMLVFIFNARLSVFAKDNHPGQWTSVEEKSYQMRNDAMFNLFLESPWYDFLKIISPKLIEHLYWIYCFDVANNMWRNRVSGFGFYEYGEETGDGLGCDSSIDGDFLDVKNAAGLMFRCYGWDGRLFGTYAVIVRRIKEDLRWVPPRVEHCSAISLLLLKVMVNKIYPLVFGINLSLWIRLCCCSPSKILIELKVFNNFQCSSFPLGMRGAVKAANENAALAHRGLGSMFEQVIRQPPFLAVVKDYRTELCSLIFWEICEFALQYCGVLGGSVCSF